MRPARVRRKRCDGTLRCSISKERLELNVLKSHLRITVQTLLKSGTSQREIERITGVDRKTIRRYAALSKSSGVATGSDGQISESPPPRPPALASSACEVHRPWIETQVQLGRNAMSIYQDLVESHGFEHRYNSVKRFVHTLRAREPERFDVLEFLPGEESQVDYGQGALTRAANGKYSRPYLFVMTLKYSGKCFRKVTWKTSQEIWARLHEQAWRSFGGSSRYVVLDNLREGVIKPDLYAPELNPVYAAMLDHYGVIADVCRVRDPNRKGTVERAIQYTQDTALKGRKFESIEEQNSWLAHWEERWAAPRIHGRKKRQILEMFAEEKPHLRPLPLEGMRYFRQETRTVDDGGAVQVDGSFYAAGEVPLYSEATVRVYSDEIEVLNRDGLVVRRHPKSTRKGHYEIPAADRIFNPSRETLRLLGKARKIGPHSGEFAQQLFSRLGRPGQKAIYGLTNLPRHYAAADIEAACARVLCSHSVSYQTVKRLLEHQAQNAAPAVSTVIQADPAIRPIDDYQRFWDEYSQSQQQEHHDAHVDERT
jgi:transposase